MSLGVAPSFSLKKIKNNPTKAEKIEKINNNLLVSKLEANNVPRMTPRATKIPNDLIKEKSTALNYMWVLVDITEVGIIIARDVPKDKCILVASSNPKTVKA